MGFPMAVNLANKGHKVFGYDVDASKAKEASQKNIIFKNKISEVAKESDIFVAMVPNSKHSIDVCEQD